MSAAVPGLLVVWSGAGPRHDIHRIEAGVELAFGRDLADPSDDRISRVHARFRIRDGRVYVVDSSRNGTFLNGKAIQGSDHEALPAVIRMGWTVAVAVPDVRRYETAREPGGASLVEQTHRAIDEAARAEVNITIEAQTRIGLELAQRYAATVGGTTLIFDPGVQKSGLEIALYNSRPTTVMLMLVTSALPRFDMATVEDWLETDVRFVTVMMYDCMPLSLLPQQLVDRLRSCVVTVYPQFVEIPRFVYAAVREIDPGRQIHSKAIELMLLEARRLEHDELMTRFRAGLERWRIGGATVLRDDDLVGALRPVNPNHCIAIPYPLAND